MAGFNSFSGIAIQPKDEDYLVILDVVTSLDKNFSATVTSHPVDGGKNGTGFTVVDHVTIDNPKLTLNAVISASDFNMMRPTLEASELSPYKSSGVINSISYADQQDMYVTVESPPSPSMIDIVTDVTGVGAGILAPARSVAKVKETRSDPKTVADIKEIIYKFWRTGTVWNIFELSTQGMIEDKYFRENWVLTSLSFTEDEETGDSVNVAMSFEQITVVNSGFVQFPKPKAHLKKKSSGKKDKGNMSAQPAKCPDSSQPVHPNQQVNPKTGSVTILGPDGSLSDSFLNTANKAFVEAMNTRRAAEQAATPRTAIGAGLVWF